MDTPKRTLLQAATALSYNRYFAGYYYEEVTTLVTTGINGVWKHARIVATNISGHNIFCKAYLPSISISSVGNTVACGFTYTDRYADNVIPGFNNNVGYFGGIYGTYSHTIVEQIGGVWQPATTYANQLDSSYDALLSVSCSSDSNAIACGSYITSSYEAFIGYRPLIMSKVDGSWNTLTNFSVDNFYNFNLQFDASYGAFYAVSTSSDGNGIAVGNVVIQNINGGGGGYQTATLGSVLSLKNGVWGPIEYFAAEGVLFGSLLSCSASSDGNGVAGGLYYYPGVYMYDPFPNVFMDSYINIYPIVINQVNGSWQYLTAISLPSDASGVFGMITSVSACSDGNAVAGGLYLNDKNQYAPMIAEQINGVWGTAFPIVIPGTYNGTLAYPYTSYDSVTEGGMLRTFLYNVCFGSYDPSYHWQYQFPFLFKEITSLVQVSSSSPGNALVSLCCWDNSPYIYSGRVEKIHGDWIHLQPSFTPTVYLPFRSCSLAANGKGVVNGGYGGSGYVSITNIQNNQFVDASFSYDDSITSVVTACDAKLV